MADSVSPPPEVPPLPEMTDEARKAAFHAFHEASQAVAARWDLSHEEEEDWRLQVGTEAAARIAFAAGVAAGRTRAADYLDQRAQKIAATATSPADRGLAAGLRNVARELREGQENT